MKKIVALLPLLLLFGCVSQANNQPVKPNPYVKSEFILERTETGAIYDKTTGLMWASRDNGQPISWKGAIAYCDGYAGDGYNDWRMPTLSELQTLYAATIEREIPGKDYSIHAPEQIRLSGGWVAASETHGVSSGYVFSYVNGKRTFGLKSAVHPDLRALPVRLQGVISQTKPPSMVKDAANAGLTVIDLLQAFSWF